MRTKRNIALFVLGMFLIISCSSEKEIKKTERIIPAKRLLVKMEGNRREIKTFHGTGTIKVKSKKFNGSTPFEIYIKKPDSIKVSIYGPFGIDIAHGIFSKNSFMFYDVMHNRVYYGSDKKNILQKLFRIDLSFNDLLDSFTGAVNLTSKLRTLPSNYQVLDDIYKLSYVNKKSKIKSEYIIAKDNLRILDYIVYDSSNKEILSGKYSKFKDYEGVPIPSSLLLRNKMLKQSLTVNYKKIVVNKEIKSLSIKLPTDVEKIKW